jgi:peptidyl-prolyl cis-trans isomerase C
VKLPAALSDLVPKAAGPRLALGFIGTLLVPVVVVGLSVLLAVRFTSLPDNAAFRLYDHVVTKADLKQRQTVLKALYGIEEPADPRAKDLYQRQSAQAVALSMVLDHAATQQGVVIEDKTARTLLQQMVQDRFPDGINGFVHTLAEVGASQQDVIDEIKRQQATRKLFEKVVSTSGASAPVSEADAKAFYDQHTEKFIRPEARHIRNIVVDSQDDANDVAQQARAGGDFVALAKQYTLDDGSRDTGGDLGFVTRDQVEAPFAQAAFSTPVNATFGPIQAKHGWNVGQVLEIRPSAQVPFEQVKDQLRSQLQAQHQINAWRAWVNEQVADADLTYAKDFEPVNANQPLPPLPLSDAGHTNMPVAGTPAPAGAPG